MARSGKPGPGQATDQLSRMLALVPFISRRPGISIAELAAEFGVGHDQVVDDLKVLMMCGEPGYYPNDLIDVVFDDEDGTVAISYDAGLDRPTRLTPDELITLTVALRSLADLPGLIDGEAVHSALQKLEALAGGASGIVAVSPVTDGPALATVREAVAAQRRLAMTYYTAARDSLTEREVDPIRLLAVDGHLYLEGYCYRAESIRRFRIDRIESAQVLDLPAQQVLWADSDVPDVLFRPSRESSGALLELDDSALWVTEYFPVEHVPASSARQGAGEVVRIFGPDDEWLIRLVLSLGGAGRVLDRPDLAAEIRRRAREALVGYGVIDHSQRPTGPRVGRETSGATEAESVQ